MGRSAAVSADVIFDTLSTLPIFHSDGSLKKELFKEIDGSMVWNKAAKSLEMNRTTLYLEVFHNRHYLRRSLEEAANIINTNSKYDLDTKCEQQSSNEMERLRLLLASEQEDQKENTKDLRDCDPDYELPNDEKFDEKQKNPQNCDPIHFSIHLDEDSWRIIKPRNDSLPKYEWTPVIVRKICETVDNFQCAHCFKVGKPYKTLPHKYIDFYGFCKECGTYIYGVCTKKPEDDSEGVTFNISTYDTRHIKHALKRPLFFNQRLEAKKTLKYVKASRYKLDQVNERMNYSEVEPPDLCRTYTYRKARVEAINEYIGLKGPSDVLESLFYLAEKFTFIREICTDPFRLWYWSENQIDLWEKLESLNPVVTVDATGSLVKKVAIGDDECGSIFLYQLLTTAYKKYAPLSQMISSRHDTNIIKNWLDQWIKSIPYKPKQTVCDGSLALLNALSWSLNKCSYKRFNFVILLHVLGVIETLPFSCLLTLDKAHFIKSVGGWNGLKGKSKELVNVRDFYMRCIAFASTCTNFGELKKIMISLFVISESKYMPLNSECHKRKVWLQSKIETFEHDFKATTNECDDDEEEPVICEFENTDKEIEREFIDNGVLIWLNKLYEASMSLTIMEGDIKSLPNTLRRPIKGNLMYIFSQFASWSQVAYKSFGIVVLSTSASNESYFKDLANTYGFTHPVTANKFVKHHMLVVDGQTTAVRAIMKNENKQAIGDAKITCDKPSICNPEENKNDTEVEEIMKTRERPSIYKPKPDKYNNEEKEVIKTVRKSKLEYNRMEILTRDIACENQDEEASSSSLERRKGVQEKHQTISATVLPIENYDYPLRNGGMVRLGMKDLYFTHTCAYDSNFDAFTHLYATNDRVKQFVLAVSQTNSFFRSVIGYCERTMSMDEIYKIRAEILYPWADRSKLKNNEADCECNVNALLEKLLQTECPIKRVVKCKDCSHERKNDCRNLIIQSDAVEQALTKIAAGKSNNFFYECIQYTLNGDIITCRKCKSLSASTSINFDTYVSFDFEEVFRNNGSLSTNIIPLKIIFYDKTLRLEAFIVYVPRVEGNEPHYYCYCYNHAKRLWEIRDDTKRGYRYTQSIPCNLPSLPTLFYGIVDI